MLTFALAGCGLGNPTVVVGPDGSVVLEDLGVDAGVARDLGADNGGRDVGGDGGDAPDAPAPPDVAIDLGSPDSGMPDSGEADSGPIDAGFIDVGVADTGPIDAGPRDTGLVDTGPRDTGPLDSGVIDSGPRDTGPIDTGPMDVGTPDAGPVDTGVDVPVTPDVGPPDAGTVTVTAWTESCLATGTPAINGVGRYVITGTTAGRNDDHQATCSGNEGTPDVGYLVTLAVFSRVAWQARPTGTVFAPVVTLTQSCGEQNGEFTNEVACVNNAGAAGAARGGTVDLPAGSYYLTVDGDRDGSSTESGPFEVTVTVTASEPAPYYNVDALTSTTCANVPNSGTVRIDDGDDVVSAIQPLTFDFNLFGRTHNRLAFYTNGFFTLLADETAPWPANTSWRNHSLPFTAQPRGVIAPFWDDLRVDGATGSAVYFWVDGATDSRVAHVTWRNATFFYDSDSRVSVEARLYQGTDVIEFLYCNENRNSSYTRGGSATVGVESYDQTQGRLEALNRVGSVAPGTGYRFTHR